jgi:hypothetical protein
MMGIIIWWVLLYDGYYYMMGIIIWWVLLYDGYYYMLGIIIWWVLLYDGYYYMMGIIIWWVLLYDGYYYMMSIIIWWVLLYDEIIYHCGDRHSHVVLQLPAQSVPITTKVMRLNTVHGEDVLNTTLCDKACQVTFDRSVVFSGYFGFLHQ